ncbi:MAP kinase-activating death domain protein-like isoform X4 [Littorina saxatilis]|uniref:MAP kinase-activating death domain protein-like isoform X4 n=1 Tax=Littorina saxatilis TaxID=31220 RepID=UPI0038B49FD6
MDLSKYFCPRLLDYLVIVGSRHPNSNNHVSQTPELLRRYPLEDHKDFNLPTDVIFFCQPEGCISVGPKRMSLRETTSFVFTLTEKDSGIMRYGICVNFYRPFERRTHSSECWQKVDRSSTGSTHSVETLSSSECDRPRSPRARRRSRVRNNTLTSLCIISHHPFFSTFRECLFILRRLIEACHDRSCVRRVGGSKATARDTVWGVLTGQTSDNISTLVMHEVREIETWILRLLSAPVPVPGKTRVEVNVLPKDLQAPLLFALPDSTRFGLVDFPLHLPLELLGVDTCLKVLSAIMLEHKVILQSRDYNALSMSVLAFVSMLYPLEYMFPVIPLLPTCMASAEQLLLAPTPYLIGVPASFFRYKRDFPLPDDIWVCDLDANKIICPTNADPLPPLPEPEAIALKTHLKQALASMSMTPQPIKNLDAIAQNPEMWQRRESFSSQTGFNPLIYGNDVDSVDVATRVAMVRFFNSQNILGNFTEHTRTLRLYPRPVVAFQLYSFMKSRPQRTHFTARLARTQAVEYFGEWSLCPDNLVYQRVQTGVYDPSLIGDKPKWYAQHLQPVEFHVYDNASSLAAAITSVSESLSDEIPTDESGSDSEGAESTSSSYSSLSDLIAEMTNSEIDGETPSFIPENQILAVDEAKVFCPPNKLHVPEAPSTNSDSAFSLQEDSDMSSSESSSAVSSPEPITHDIEAKDTEAHKIFRYDSGNITETTYSMNSTTRSEGPGSPRSPALGRQLPPSPQPPLHLQAVGRGSPSPVPPGESFEKPHLLPPPLGRRPPSPRPHLGSFSSGGSSSSTKKGFKQGGSDAGSDKGSGHSGHSIMSTISNELTDIAQSATSTMSDFFGSKNAPAGSHPPPQQKPPSKPFTPLGNRKALVEKSGLVKHASSFKQKEQPKPPNESRTTTNSRSSRSFSENQQFLKEVINGVLDGQGLSWLKVNRIKKLMEDENYRNFVVSRLNRNLDKKLPEDARQIEDVCVARPVYKGMLAMSKAIIAGLEHTIQNHGLGGMASAYMVLEIAHTHFWHRDLSSSKSDTSSLHGSQESLHSKDDLSPRPDLRRLSDDLVASASSSPVIVNGDEFQNIEIAGLTPEEQARQGRPPDNSPHHNPHQHPNNPHNPHSHQGMGDQVSSLPYQGDPLGVMPDMNRNIGKPGSMAGEPVPPGASCDIIITDADINSSSGDMLRDLVKNKELLRSKTLDKKFNSVDSEISEASTLVSTGSDRGEGEKGRCRIAHQSIRGALSDSEMDNMSISGRRRSRSSSLYSNKSNHSIGYRYHDNKLVHTGCLPGQDVGKTYIFEGLIGKERSRMWDQMQFWEDMFLDAVAQERDIIGMDQRPSEMMERYNSLGDGEKKRLEHDEDRLLSVMLYNLVGFMLMMRVPKPEVKKKIRRLLGKSHIGLLHSQDVNNLLDNITHLQGNDIDLKPMGSRQMQKQTFTVHWGPDNTGDMLFMEVCDDCLLLRSVTGMIHDRWWFEKLVNMTYCPKTKVLCLWRKNGEKVALNQFYTKKCRELYFCVKEAMEKAASRNSGRIPGDNFLKSMPKLPMLNPEFSVTDTLPPATSPELGGEFPVQDLKSGQGGLLQVCMEGIGLLLANSKSFIELSRIRKCFTLKGGIFVLEEFDSKTKQVIQHKFKSSMANEAAVMFHRIVSVQWAKPGDGSKRDIVEK